MLTVNGKQVDWSDGITATDLLKIMGYDYSLIVVSINDQTIHKDDYNTIKIEDNSIVNIMHICHGG